MPRDYDVFAGLDVDHHSIAATFTDHQRLMQSLRLPYSAGQLLNYVRKHFPQQRLVLVYEAGPTGFGLYDELETAGYSCLVVAPQMVPRARDPELREFYSRVYQRHPKKVAARKAIVAVTRKLTTRIYAVLKEQWPFVLRAVNQAPLTAEETAGHRERLDGQQNDQSRQAGSGRFALETENPGFRLVIQLDRENPNREGRIHESVPTIESGHASQSVSLAG